MPHTQLVRSSRLGFANKEDHGLVSLDYSLSFEQPGILKVEIFREFYGAYLTGALDTYHFDASTYLVDQKRTVVWVVPPESPAASEAGASAP